MSKSNAKAKNTQNANVESEVSPPAPVTPIAPQAPKVSLVQNGVAPPQGETGICARIWLSINAYRTANGGNLPTLQQVKAWGTANGVDLVTCAVQYYRYRKHAGIRGRAQATAPTLTPVA